MGDNKRANASAGPPFRGYLFSPSLIRRADLLSDQPIAYYETPRPNLALFETNNNNHINSQPKGPACPNWDVCWKPPTSSTHYSEIYNKPRTNNSWDPDWKILSSEKPSSNHRRDFRTEFLSMRPHDLNYPRISNTNYHKERIENDIQSSSSYGTAKTNMGSYSRKFSQGEPYLPLNKSINYPHPRGTQPQMEHWPKVETCSSKSTTPYTYYDRPTSPSKISYNKDDLYKTFSIHTDPVHLIDGALYQGYQTTAKVSAKKTNKFPRQDGCMEFKNANHIMPERMKDIGSDNLALIRKRFQLNDETNNAFIKSTTNDECKGHSTPVSTPVRLERRRSLSVVPIRTGWTEKIEPILNEDLLKTHNLNNKLESDDNASVHNYLKRENNYNSAKGRYDLNSSETQISNAIDTNNYASTPNLDLSWDKSEDETKSCHDFYKTRLKHKSQAKTPPNKHITTPQRRQLSENKTVYTTTEELKDFPTTPNNKWLGDLVVRLKFSTNEWNMNLQALLDTRRLAKYHPSMLFHMTPISNTSATFNPLNLRIVISEVVKLLNSPRSSLAKHAALCLMDLYYFGGKKMDHVNEDIVPSCLKKSSQNSSDFLSEAAYCVLVQMCRHITPTKALNTILHLTHTSRHQGFKTVGVKCVTVLIHRLRAHITKTKEISAVIELLKTTLFEASSEIRNVSKTALLLLMRYIGDKVEELIDNGTVTEADIKEFETATSRVDESQLDAILDPYQHTNIFGTCTPNKITSISYQPGIKTRMKAQDY